MQANGINTLYSNGATQKPKAKGEMGKDEFLQLLVTQLQHQDPLNPVENTEFVSQLAQFSSLEGITNMSTSMEDVTRSVNQLNSFSAASLIGRSVIVKGDTFDLSGEKSKFGYKIESDAAEVKAVITDEDKKIVKTIELGNKKAGEYLVEWDGKNEAGVKMPDGLYKVAISALDARKDAVESETYVLDKVSGVEFDQKGKASVIVNGESILFSDIKEIY